MDQKHSIGEICIETQQLAERLKAMRPGEVVTYDELSAVAGRDVQAEARSMLYTARKHAEAHLRSLFSTVHGIGWKLLHVDDAHSILTERRHRVRRQARRELRRSAAIDYNSMSPEDRKILNNERTLLAFVVASTTENSARLVAANTTPQDGELNRQQVMKLFSKRKVIGVT